ncbi:MAG: chemotaxis protein CheB, partial [Planctomycetaceae bacterium]
MIARLCVRYTLACLLLAVASSAAIADDMVIHWNRIHLDAIRADKTPPPMAARNLAIMHTAIYDAVNSFDQTHRPYLVWANAPNKSSVVAAAAGAAHTALVELYPARAAIFDAELDDSLTEIPRGPAKSGAQFGRAVARKILKARRNDGADRVVAYTPGTAPGEWRPTPPAFAPALLPQWPFVTPFAMFAGSQFRPAGPPAADSDAYTASFDEVAVMGSVNSPLRTAEQTEIALFWADGAGSEPPP